MTPVSRPPASRDLPSAREPVRRDQTQHSLPAIESRATGPANRARTRPKAAAIPYWDVGPRCGPPQRVPCQTVAEPTLHATSEWSESCNHSDAKARYHSRQFPRNRCHHSRRRLPRSAHALADLERVLATRSAINPAEYRHILRKQSHLSREVTG